MAPIIKPTLKAMPATEYGCSRTARSAALAPKRPWIGKIAAGGLHLFHTGKKLFPGMGSKIFARNCKQFFRAFLRHAQVMQQFVGRAFIGHKIVKEYFHNPVYWLFRIFKK